MKRVLIKSKILWGIGPLAAHPSSPSAKLYFLYRKSTQNPGIVAIPGFFLIVIICLIALIVGSYFGIFFSGEDTGVLKPAVIGWYITQIS